MNKSISNRKQIVIFVLLVIVLSILSFGKAVDYNFWRDDWTLLWQAKYDRVNFLNWLLSIRHPGEVFNTYFGIYLFGINPKIWQLSGLFLKIIASFVVGLGVYGLSNSKKLFFISCLLYASTYGGIESYTWLSARLSVYVLIISGLALYFYSLSYFRQNYYYFLISLILVIFDLFLEPGRGIFLPFLLFVWEMVQRYIDNKLKKGNLFIRLILIILTSFAGLNLTSFGKSFFSGSTSSNYLQILINNKKYIFNYFHSMGNILAVYFRGLDEWAGLSTDFRYTTAYLGVIILFLFLGAIFYMFIKRNKLLPLVLFSFLWVFIFYLPSWLSEMPLYVGVSHRYLTLSYIGYIWIGSLFVAKLKRFGGYLLVVIVLFNLIFSHIIDRDMYKIRGYKITQPLYDEQERSVPSTDDQKMFFVFGNHYLRGYVFDWATTGAVPFALKRSFGESSKIPVFGVDYILAGKLICEEGVRRPDIRDWVVQEKVIPIDQVYGWKVNDSGTLENITNQVRISVAHHSDCIKEVENDIYIEGITLKNIVEIDNLPDKTKAVSLAWDIEPKDYSQIGISIDLINERGDLVVSSKEDIDLMGGADRIYLETPVFYQSNNAILIKDVRIKINYCIGDCVVSKELLKNIIL